MFATLIDLSRYAALVEEERFSIKEVIFAPDGWHLTHLAVDTGGWFKDEVVVVSAETLTAVDHENRTMTLNTTKQAVMDAPRWQDNDAGASLLAAMPPLVVGPFGMTHSPLMLVAALNGPGAIPAGQPQPKHLESMQTWRGLDVFGPDGKVGTLNDLIVNTDTLQITDMVIDDGGIIAGRQLVVPIGTLRYMAEKHTHVVITLTAEQLAKAPQLEEIDRIERNWRDAFSTYYALPV
jgi:uncharacterized protein YrrD